MYFFSFALLLAQASSTILRGRESSAASARTAIDSRTSPHEKRNGEPIAWRKDARAAAHHVLPMKIGLKQRNLEFATGFIEDIADPESVNYGKHWSAQKVANMFAPAKESSDRTIEWLVDHGINIERIGHSKGRNWIELNATIAEAEYLLDTKYHVFEHHQSGGFRIACDEYSIPNHLKSHIDFVMPTIQLDGLQPISQAKPATMFKVAAGSGLTGTKNCGQLITIPCLRALYGFGKGNYSEAGNKLGIPEWSDYLYHPDLKKFFEQYTDPQIPSDTLPEFVSIDGGKTSNASVEIEESNLDFQLAYSIIWPQQIIQYQLGDSVNVDSVGTFNIFLDALDESYCSYLGGNEPYIDPVYPDPNEGGYTGPLQCGGAPKTNVISTSYLQLEAALPRFYQERQCHEWMKLGLQGVSVIFASGDSGVANRYNVGSNNSCVNAKDGYVDVNGTAFSPSFPANCPYVTTVGATQLKTKSVYGGEVAVSYPDPDNPLMDFYSGGGFSNVFPTPSYQSKQVKNYISKYAPDYPASTYNRTGRGFPDVSAVGLNITSIQLGETYASGGTSASTPIFASLINLINEERLRANKSTVGFLNPTIYKYPGMFHDIVEGGNPGCGTEGFPATKGWDPVTGMGTPRYERMKEVFMKLP